MEENLDNVLEFNGKNFVRNGKEVTEAETQNLIASAQALTSNDFFLSLLKSLRREGFRRFETSKLITEEDIEAARFGKALLYIADVLGQKVVNASKIPPPKLVNQKPAEKP